MSRASDGKDDAIPTDIEDRIDAMIDSLREERRPADPESALESELLVTAKLVKSVRKQAEPSPDFGEKLAASTTALATAAKGRHSELEKEKTGGIRSGWKSYSKLIAGIAAALVLIVTLTLGPKLWNNDVAYAMSKAVGKLTSYHGVLQKSYKTSDGSGQVVRTVEVWSYGDMYATRRDDGIWTVHNGEKKWQVRPAEMVVALLPVAPDPDRSGLDLREQAKRALEYPHTVVGEDVVAERNTVCIEISPPGGLPYHLWIDKETNLPLQLRTAAHNGIQTTYTYTLFEGNADIDPSIFEYKVPVGFAVVDDNPGQWITAPTEALGIAGFMPVVPDSFIGNPMVAHSGAVRILVNGDEGVTVITQKPAEGEFKPVNYAAIGTVAGGPLEVLDGRLRWQQNGVEITVEGPDSVVVAKLFAPDLVMPEESPVRGFAPQVEVQVDMEIAANDQKQVDGGHSPWQLDPVMVSVSFVNQKVYEGTFEGPNIGEDLCTVEASDGVRSIVSINKGPVAKVYLQKLVRQDESGIWSVVGYDLR
mgnify:CR=1 FL=1